MNGEKDTWREAIREQTFQGNIETVNDLLALRKSDVNCVIYEKVSLSWRKHS
jgi:hypothetical protein